MAEIKSIAVLAYDRCSESDTIIPWEIMIGVAVYLKETAGEDIEVKLVALEEGPVTMQMGARVEPHAVLQDDDLYDVLYVPGGRGSGAASRGKPPRIRHPEFAAGIQPPPGPNRPEMVACRRLT